tara:strand:+ start:1717 stop:2550 length:834 start_codon:yes stop_codon:yes gene_type:complete
MMKAKHNKKRNTAFVYEALIKEATIAVLKNDNERSKKAVDIIREHFNSDSLLTKDLECYRSLYENQSLEPEMSEKILREANISRRMINPDDLFAQQTNIINDVNKTLSPSVFNNFVPNYKALATINKMFNTSSPKEKIILETKIINEMSNTAEVDDNQIAIDNVVYRTFVTKFNEKYDEQLLEEQKNLLSHYITSFSDNSLELKMFLNEEIGRLKEKLTTAKNSDEINSDSSMSDKTQQILDRLDGYSQETISENVIMTVLKTQQLVKEIFEDVSQD